MTTSIVMRPWPAQHVNLNLLSLKEPIVIDIQDVILETFWNSLNYASIANIQEVMNQLITWLTKVLK